MPRNERKVEILFLIIPIVICTIITLTYFLLRITVDYSASTAPSNAPVTTEHSSLPASSPTTSPVTPVVPQPLKKDTSSIKHYSTALDAIKGYDWLGSYYHLYTGSVQVQNTLSCQLKSYILNSIVEYNNHQYTQYFPKINLNLTKYYLITGTYICAQANKIKASGVVKVINDQTNGWSVDNITVVTN